MRRTIINKSTAIKAVIAFFALLMIISIYPLRVWNKIIVEHENVDVTQRSERINDYHDVVQKFIAAYDRIDSVDVYIDGLEKGKYMAVTVFDPDMQTYYERFINLSDYEIPGYVTIPMKLDLTVGETYTLLLNGSFSTFFVGYNQQDKAVYPNILNCAYHDTEVQGMNLAAELNYSQPIAKKTSLLMMLGIAFLAVVLCLCVDLFYKNKKDKLITVHRVIKYVGNPIAALLTITLMILIFPVKMFDDRVIEIIFYEIGTVIAGFFMFYAINHESDATLDTKLWHNARNFLMMSAIALAIWFCCEYMNAFFTIYQTLAERKEMIFLLLFLCMSIPKKKLLKGYNLAYLLVAAFIGIWYRSGHLMVETEKEYDLHNAATTYAVIVVILTGFMLLNIIFEVIDALKKTHNTQQKKILPGISPLGILIVLLFAALVIFRNTRWWGVVLALFVFGLMFCYKHFGFSEDGDRSNYPGLIAGGLLLNFTISMIYSLLYRNFAAFNSGRFAFVFHTVTITAEYMTVMECAALVLLFYKIYDTREIDSFKTRFRYMWKEFLLFGFVSAYMIFTMSRTAYLACVVMVIFACGISSIDCKEEKFKYFRRQFCTMLIAVIICFPAAFTLQRTIPAIYGHPKVFHIIEKGNYGINGGGNPKSTLYMSLERFADLFCEKILSMDLINYNYPEDKANYDENGYPIYGDLGIELDPVQAELGKVTITELLQSKLTSDEDKKYLHKYAGKELGLKKNGKLTKKKRKELKALQEEMEKNAIFQQQEEEDSEAGALEELSNGRFDIFRAYLSQINFSGHEEMGAELPSGEIAVHAHNTYIQVMYDNGIIAGLCFGLMIAGAIISGGVYYIRKRDEVPGAMLPYAMTVGFGVAALTEWVFQLGNPMAIAFMLSLMPLVIGKQKN